jgi:N-ethylmaleimide reductase
MSVSVRPEAAAAAEGTPEELLFQPYRLGPYDLPHRIVMAPLTRSRARQPGNVPGPLNACYYVQRASAALIISEATQVSMQGQGYAWTPGIHSREQVEGWRLVTEAVHRAGGRIFNQLWHVGRISHPCLQPDYMLPVAPSAIKPSGMAFIENENGEGELVPFVTPRALQIEEMPYLVRQYFRGARNAMRGLRRRRDPRRQRLSAGAVHRFRHQSARRPVWRSGPEPGAAADGSGRDGD